MKKTALLFTLILAFFATSFAENVDLTQAQRVAESLLTSKMGYAPDIHLVEYANRGSFSNFYVFGNESCFVIVSADDCVTPIIGYSTENGFSQSAMPDNVFHWLKAYDEEIGTIISHHVEASDAIRSEWTSLLNGNGLEPKTRTSVSPLLLTTWDQTTPYNSLCPVNSSGGSGGHAYTGCVATAMAQVMNYWEHPVKGTGSHSYNCPSYGQQSANFASTTYDWDHMKNTYSGSSTTAEITAVATLMYHCGISVEMAYGTGTSGSAASSGDVPSALTTYFNYASSTQLRMKSSYSDSQWITMLKTELDNARPVYYFGQSGSVGHAFVCDGYDNSNLFHFNWGWSGSNNGYYAMGALNPGAGGTGSGQGEYNLQNGAIFGCQPATPSINPPTNVNSSVSGRNVTITWTAASGASSYKVYRDGNLLASGVSGTSYTDNNVTYGIHVYYLKSVASNGTMSLKSANTIADVHFAGPVPTNLQGTQNSSNVTLTWTAPASETATLQYGTGSCTGGVGYNGSADTYWAQRFPASTLALYAGMAINKVSVYFFRTGSYTLNIYKGNETGTTELVKQQSYNATATGWKDITLSTPAVVDYSQDLWIVMQAPSSIDYPAAYCSYSGTDVANACYISPDGTSWSQYSTTSSTTSWLMKTYMTDGTYTYRVYRNGTAIATNVSGTTYTDPGLANGTYNYYVTTNYYGGESDHSNTCSVVVDGSSIYTISVSAEPAAGGNVSVSGTGTFNYNQSCTITATPNTGYTFVNWTKNGTQVSTSASYTFNVTESATYVAHFQLQSYTITATANPTAGGTVSGGGTYNHGATCNLTASANPGYTFVNWTEGGTQVSTNPSLSFTVTSNRTLVANFQQQSYTITATANPVAGGNVSGGGTFTHGASCTLTATANSGYTFVNWTEGGTQVSTNPSLSFTVTSNRTLVANFQLQSYTITATANPAAGGNVSGGGTYNHGASCNLTATANPGYTFVNWTEGGTQVSTNPSLSFTVTSNRTLVANFQQQSYTVTATAQPAAGGTVSGGGTFTHGASCTLTATANSGYTFVNWTKNGTQVSTSANYTFTVTESAAYVAHFSTQSYIITAEADPAAGGTVSGGGGYDYGDACTLVATANAGYTFVNWTKNGTQVSNQPSISFTVTESATYIAHFQIQSYNVTVTANPAAGGTVSGGGTFNYGQSCTVHATANTGYNFINWTENGSPVSADADYTFTVQGNRNLVAVFGVGSYVVTAVCDPEAGGIITGAGSYNYGETCVLSITPNENYTFVNWTENGVEIGTEPTFSFTVEGSHSFVAHLLFYDGISENGTQVELYPNPADELLHIEGKDIRKVVIVNIFGQVMETMETEGQEALMFNIEHYEPATYIMIIHTENGVVTRRFVKR